MEEKIELIKKHLTEIGEELFKKYGTDSYSIRCAIADVKDSVSKLHQPTVSGTVCDKCECIVLKDLGLKDKDSFDTTIVKPQTDR
jgi:hypothetical protein